MRQLLQLFKECSEKTYTKFLTCLEDISKETATILQKRQRNLKDKINMNLGIEYRFFYFCLSSFFLKVHAET